MRHGLTLAALLLPLAGCVVPPPPLGYGYGYRTAWLSGPRLSATGLPRRYPDVGYPGFAYYDDSPTLYVDGAIMPLIFYGGGWGYWDRGHQWHRAPAGVEGHLNQRFPGGAGYHPWGGGPAGAQMGGEPEGVQG